MNKYYVISLVVLGFLKVFSNKKKQTNKFSKIVANQTIRNCDLSGCGYYLADRGNKDHSGIDIIASVGSVIYAPISGSIRRLYVYSNSQEMKGVEITSVDGNTKVKLFYIDTNLQTNYFISKGEVIGIAQNISLYHNAIGRMINHIHVEVRKFGKLINPTNLF